MVVSSSSCVAASAAEESSARPIPCPICKEAFSSLLLLAEETEARQTASSSTRPVNKTGSHSKVFDLDQTAALSLLFFEHCPFPKRERSIAAISSNKRKINNARRTTRISEFGNSLHFRDVRVTSGSPQTLVRLSPGCSRLPLVSRGLGRGEATITRNRLVLTRKNLRGKVSISAVARGRG